MSLVSELVGMTPEELAEYMRENNLDHVELSTDAGKVVVHMIPKKD